MTGTSGIEGFLELGSRENELERPGIVVRREDAWIRIMKKL